VSISASLVWFSHATPADSRTGDSLEPLLGIHQSTITILLIIPVLVLTNLRHMSELAPLSLIASASLCIALFLILSASVHRFFKDIDPEIPTFRASKIISFFVSTIYAYEGEDPCPESNLI
jgi:hypothetical protein